MGADVLIGNTEHQTMLSMVEQIETAFVYDETQDCYYCPAGKPLSRTGEEKRKRGNKPAFLQIIYTCSECAGCP